MGCSQTEVPGPTAAESGNRSFSGRVESAERESREGEDGMDSQSAGGLPAADWYPDPSGRHGLRYWDGAAWTHNVVDGGQVPADAVDAPALDAVDAPGLDAVYAQLLQPVDADGPTTGDRNRRTPNRRARILILCTIVVLVGAIAAVVLTQRYQHAEQVKREAAALASQAQAADKLASELDSAATGYAGTVAGIESALAHNVTAVRDWKKEWAKHQADHKKKMAAYRTKVAAVNAFNSSRWVFNVRTTYYEASRPGFLLYQEPSIPSGDVWYVDGFCCDGVYVDKILTRRATRPKGPRRQLPLHPSNLKAPSVIEDPVRDEEGTLSSLQTRLDDLTAELDSAKLGPQFLPVADEIRNGIELLRTDIDLALDACSTAVRHDRSMGYVAVQRNLTTVDVTGVEEAVQAVRVSLVDAAQTHGVKVSALVWASATP